MELIKNIIKYFVILLIILFCVCGILAGVMFFFPNVKIFGLQYVDNHKNNYVSYSEMAITKVNIETNNYDIIILPNSEEGVTVNKRFKLVFENNFVGFSNGVNQTQIEIPSLNEEKEYLSIVDFNEMNFSKFKNGSEITIKLVEPVGLLSNNSKVLVYIPENLTGIEYNLKTNTGAIIFDKNTVNSNQKLSTSNIQIDVKSAFGSFNLDNAKMIDGSNLVISNYIGKVNINSDKIGNVVIDSNSGNFTFKNIGYDGFNGGDLTISGNNPYVRVDTIYGNANFTSITGFLEVKEIKGDAIINTENGIIRIDKALGGVQSSNNSGETTIKQIGTSTSTKKSVTIISNSGAITLGGKENGTIKGIYYLDKITAESSKVVVNNLYSAVSEIETTKGSVTINFAENENKKDLKVNTVSGAITLNNIYGKIEAKTQKSSKITAGFYKIANGETSAFETDEGTIELTLPAPTNNVEKQYNLNMQSRKNKVSVNIGNYNLSSFAGEKDNNGYYNFTKTFPEGVTTVNTISLKTNSGNLIVKE